MKKLMFALAMVMLLCGTAFAEDCFNAKGSAIVPCVMARYHSSSYFVKTNFTISNITDSDVTCRVKVFDHDGNDVSTNCSVSTGSDSTSYKKLSTGVNEFVIPAHSTRIYNFFKNNMAKSIAGYAVIEWTSSNENLRKAIVATTRMNGVAGQFYSNMSFINNGQPF